MNEQQQDLITNAYTTIKNLIKKSKDTSIPEAFKIEFIERSESIQQLLNAILSKGGVVTQEQLDALDEQLKQTKVKLLESEAQKTKRKYTIILASTIGLIAIISIAVYLKRKNS
jgi:formate dehydrogenase maturation protein FdhE